MAGRWEESKADRQDTPTKVCHGCGSESNSLFTVPGQIRLIGETKDLVGGGWWHIPCYNESTPDAKDAAAAVIVKQWAVLEKKWKNRANRHCNGGPGGTKFQTDKLKELGQEEYDKRTNKSRRETARALIKRRIARGELVLTQGDR